MLLPSPPSYRLIRGLGYLIMVGHQERTGKAAVPPAAIYTIPTNPLGWEGEHLSVRQYSCSMRAIPFKQSLLKIIECISYNELQQLNGLTVPLSSILFRLVSFMPLYDNESYTYAGTAVVSSSAIEG